MGIGHWFSRPERKLVWQMVQEGVCEGPAMHVSWDKSLDHGHR